MIKSGSLVSSVNLPRLTIANGTIEILKLLALGLMSVDHINKYIYNGTIPGLTEFGRLAMPLFAFIFAYNLSRPDTLKNGVYQRVFLRLSFIGAISSLPYILLGGVQLGWWPLNILFTLLVSALVISVLDKGGKRSGLWATLVFLLGGFVVEFWWPAIIISVSAWSYCKTPGFKSLLIWVTATVSLYVINGNFWALLTLPIIFSAPYLRVNFPRWKNAFYVFYPAHLFFIWFIVLEDQ